MGNFFSRRRNSRRSSAKDASAPATQQPQSSNAASSTKSTAETQPTRQPVKQPAEQPATSSSNAGAVASSTSATEPATEPIQIQVDRADTEEVQPPPDADAILEAPQLFEREWLPREELKEDGHCFSMMNFNILANGLSGVFADDSSREKLFVRVPLHVLRWEYRGPRIVEEIVRWSPDILTMEECDMFDYILEELAKVGYDGRFKDKEWSPCLRIERDPPLPPDGVAIFFKTDKFEFVEQRATRQDRHRMNTYENIAKQVAKKRSSEDLGSDFLEVAMNNLEVLDGLVVKSQDESEEDQVDLLFIPTLYKNPTQGARTLEFLREDLKVDESVQFVRRSIFEEWLKTPTLPVSLTLRLRALDPKANGREFAILATHLVSTKELSGEIQRQRQLVALLEKQEEEKIFEDASVFIGCDLNAAPVDSKGYPPLAYRYLVKNKVADDHFDGDEIESFKNPFKSAMRVDDTEIGYSTWKHREKVPGKVVEDKHTIDYLFYPSEGWAVVKTLNVPTEVAVQSEQRRLSSEMHYEQEKLPSALPSAKYPSDHFSICAHFQMV